MSVIELNLRQKKLLKQLAELKQSNQLREPFTPIPVGLMNYVVYLRSRYNLRIQWISDLEALCLAGYLNYEWNRLWTSKKYGVSQAGMSVLEDETFITKEDYQREHPSLTSFDLFIDSTTQPPINESFNHLLAADLEKVTLAFKQALSESISDVELGKVIAELNHVYSNLFSQHPDKIDIAHSIKTMGMLIMGQMTGALGRSDSDTDVHAACHTLMVFSLWSKQVVKQLTI